MNILTNKTEKSYKYKCEKLDCDSVEYKIVKDFYDKTTVSKKLSSRYLQIYPQPTDGFNVYKIIKSNETKMFKEKRNNLMLFHGTNSIGAKGILTEGLKNSKKGWFGKGVYMTDCQNIANFYSSKICKDGCVYMFVNEVLKSDNLKTFRRGKFSEMGDHDNEPKHQFEKHVLEGSQKLTKKDYKEDSLGRKYRNVEVNKISQYDQYVADESFVIPRYLIVIGQTPEFLNEFKNQESDSKLKKSKPLNMDLELIEDEFTNLYHEMIKKESWYVEYKHYEDKLLEAFSQQIDIEYLSPDHEHYEGFKMRLVIAMKLVKTHIK